MPSDTQRLLAVEQELQDAKDREQRTQLTLNAILEKLSTLSLPTGPDSSNSPTPSTITPKSRPQLKPSLPNDFSGDRSTGLAFLNSCKLYISLCGEQFVDEQAQIHWALSFMKEGRASQFSDRILRKESYNQFPTYESWSAFEREFATLFLPPHRNVDAANRLESNTFYQGKRSVEEYLDEFLYLVDEAGYEEGLGIVMKFRRGLNPSLQNQIAILGQGRPADNDPEAWYAAARLYEQSHASNTAFIHSHPNSASSRVSNPIRPNTTTNGRGLIPLPPVPTFTRPSYGAGVPAPASNRPTPMDVDVTRKRNAVDVTCHRCGQPGHFKKDCPRAFDVRYMLEEEREEWIQCLLVAKDVEEVGKATDETQEVMEDFVVDNE